MNTEEKFLLRWRGRCVGPFALKTIEQKLDDREIGMLHEIFHDDQWVTLDAFFVETSRRAKVAEVASARPSTVALAGARVSAVELPIQPTIIPTGTRLVAQGLTKIVRSHGSGQEIALLEEVSLGVEPGEFVLLLGPAGSGKSTLMDALNGRRPATRGSVQLNGVDLKARFNELRSQIGYVPQKDIVHHALTVRQELTFAARLRMPQDTTAEQIDQRVTAVIEKIELRDRQHTRNAHLSGGQLKRVSLGVELLADPTLLFLDEATSGQDAGTEARLMTLFRKLAADGKTVICITHNLENVQLADLVAVMNAGQLAYYGPPSNLAAFFEVEKVTDIYDALTTRKDVNWAERFRASAHYASYVAARTGQKQDIRRTAPPTLKGDWINAVGVSLRQFGILTHRYATVTLQDRRNVLLLLAQAPIFGALVALVFRDLMGGAPAGSVSQGELLTTFVMALSAIWFGCFNAVKEIVKELPLYLRERAISLSIPAYLGSKAAVLSLLCVFQCLALHFTIASLIQFRPEQAKLLSMLVLTALCGMMLGLLVSALVSNSEKAQSIAPILMLPQIIFAGALVPLTGVAKTVGACLVVSYWSLDGLLHTLAANNQHVDTTRLAQDAAAATLGKPHSSWTQDLLFTSLFVAAFAGAALFALRLKDRPE